MTANDTLGQHDNLSAEAINKNPTRPTHRRSWAEPYKIKVVEPLKISDILPALTDKRYSGGFSLRSPGNPSDSTSFTDGMPYRQVLDIDCSI